MRSALCLYGKIGGTQGKDGAGEPIDFRECHEYIKRHIIDVNSCDVFMHCWNPEFQDKLLSLYQPKKYIIEPQIQFRTTLRTPKGQRDEFICQSRWYSHKCVLQLKKNYEVEQRFTYDWVMVCRYDLMFLVDFDFSVLDPKYLYVSNFNDWGAKGGQPNRCNHTLKDSRYLDMWFLSSSEFMDKFALLYEHFYEYSITDPHRASWDYVASFAGDPMKISKFIFYRWYDYEIYRIKIGAKK